MNTGYPGVHAIRVSMTSSFSWILNPWPGTTLLLLVLLSFHFAAPLTSTSFTSSGWPPAVVYDLHVPSESPIASFLKQAIQASLQGRGKDALRALKAASRMDPDSPETLALLAHANCEQGDETSARIAMSRALSIWSALEEQEHPVDSAEIQSTSSGDNNVDGVSGIRLPHPALIKRWKSYWYEGCVQLPLLYPPATVVHEEKDVATAGGIAVYRRVYVLEREDGEGSVLIKQASDGAPLREAFVLNELLFSRGEDLSGIPPPFPRVHGAHASESWNACALDNIQAPALSSVLREEPAYFDEVGTCFDFADRLLVILQTLQGAGVTHAAITADNVLVLAGDAPALVNFDYAIAQGMPYVRAQLPREVRDMYAGVDGEVVADVSDTVAIGSLIRTHLKGSTPAFSVLLDMMTAPKRHERVTHVLSLRLLLGSMIDNRTDLVEFRTKIVGARDIYAQQNAAFPASGIPHNNLGSVYFDHQMLNDALSLFLAAYDLELPFKSGARCNVAAVRQMMCAWMHRDQDIHAVVSVIHQGGEHVRSVRNLYAIALNLTREQHMAVSRAGAEYMYRRAKDNWAALSPTLSLLPPRAHARAAQRISLAYVSSDLLTQHAVAGSMRMVLSLHDLRRVAVALYVTKHEQVVAATVDPATAGVGHADVVDATAMSQAQLATAINARGVHIVVDCNGQTGRDAMEALSMRPALLQVHYLGFPSSLGATYIDYIVGDAQVSPPDLSSFYTEKLIYLPHTFQVTSHQHRQPHPWADARSPATVCDKCLVGLFPAEADAKRFHGLSEAGPLLCNFNQHFKLDPDMFETWANIVRRVNGSTLVLLRYPEESEPHLRTAARQVGLSGTRLLLLPKAPLPEHLARTSFCDLFVDNREYNSGTTCTDALWAGAPTISLPREKHAGRHAASMLTSLGRAGSTLQARSLQDYEDVAVALLSRPRKWREMYVSLVASRQTSALWDPAVWVRDMERAMAAAWEWRMAAHERARDGSTCEKNWRDEAAGGEADKCHASYGHVIVKLLAKPT